MAYAILRTEKLKSLGNIGGSVSHTLRTRDTLNADPGLTPRNEHFGADTPDQIKAAIAARLPDKRRSDAVLCIEYFIGSSPNAFKNRESDEKYFNDALEWLKQRHGAENVVSAHIHRDETTPHMVAYVVPRDGDKLNAKKWLGGKAVLSKMQTDFAEKVGNKHGLKRGIEGSKAKHQTVKNWYAQVSQSTVEATIFPASLEPQVTKKGLILTYFENPEAVAARLTAGVRQTYAPAVEKAKTAASDRRRAEEMARTVRSRDQTIQRLQERLRELEKAMAPFLELAKLAKGKFQELAKTATAKVAEVKNHHRGVQR